MSDADLHSDHDGYPVGVTTAVAVDDSREGRSITVEIWYPATDDARSGPLDRLDLASEGSGEVARRLGDLALPTWEQPAVRDAPARGDAGPYPLVLFSHGNAAIRWQSFSLCAHLASRGYVVAAPDHPGNTLFDQIDLPSTRAAIAGHVIDRPRDLALVLERIAGRTLSPIDAVADGDRVALMGHSFGGMTSLMMAHPTPPFLKNSFKSVVAIAAPATELATMGLSLSAIDLPVLFVAGRADRTVVLDEMIAPAYREASPPAGLVVVDGAGHITFADLLDDRLLEAAARLNFPADLREGLTDGQGADFAEPAWVHRWTERCITAWLDYTVTGDQDALAPVTGDELAAGIEFATKM